MTTIGSSFNADIYLFKGSSILDLQSVPLLGALFDAEAGVTYQLAITGFHAAGEFRLGILPAQVVSVQIRRGGATAKTGEAVHLRVQGEVGRWFILQASEDLGKERAGRADRRQPGPGL